MQIRYLGHSAFYIITDDNVRLLTDPFSPVIGYPMPRVTADIVLSSHEHFDHDYFKGVDGDYTIVKDVKPYMPEHMTITCIQSCHDPRGGALRGMNRIYKIRTNGLTLCHLGDLGEPFNVDLIHRIDQVDVLFIPVGGNYTIDAAAARRYVDAIEPKIVVPMHYKTKRCNLDIATLDEVLPHFSGYDIFRPRILVPTDEYIGEPRVCILEPETTI